MKKNNIFENKDLNKDLKKRSIRGGAVTLSTQAVLFVVQIVSTMVLARLLTPEDYGMIAMVVSITGFASVFSDLGLSTATIQQSSINQSQVSNLFWINAAIGLAVTVIVAGISPIVAWFYKTPQLLWITVALSFNFFLTGLTVQHKAVLNRQMRFLTIAKVKIVSTVLGIGVAIVMASHGFRYWALVLNTLAASASTVVGYCIVLRWWPGLPKRNSGIRKMLRFGSNVAAVNIINYFSRNSDNMIIGHYCGSLALGLYSKAYQLLMLPLVNLRTPLNTVALPSLSRLQYEKDKYRNYYMKFVSILALLTMPIVVFIFVCSDNIVRIVLGPQWYGASDIFKILAFAAFIQPVLSTRGVVLLSSGQGGRHLIFGSVNAFCTIAAYFAGLPWGVNGVAIAYVITNYILLYPSLLYVYKESPLRPIDFFTSIYKPAIAGMAAGGFGFLLHSNMVGLGDIAVIVSCFMASFSIFFFMLILVSGGTDDLKQYYLYGKIILAKKGKIGVV